MEDIFSFFKYNMTADMPTLTKYRFSTVAIEWLLSGYWVAIEWLLSGYRIAMNCNYVRVNNSNASRLRCSSLRTSPPMIV